jgi:hypothetical protein
MDTFAREHTLRLWRRMGEARFGDCYGYIAVRMSIHVQLLAEGKITLALMQLRAVT